MDWYYNLFKTILRELICLDKMFDKFKCELTDDFKEVSENWMDAYSLELKEENGDYAIYVSMFDKPEKVADIHSKDDFVKVIAEHIALYSKEDLSEDELVDLDEDYFTITGEHLAKLAKFK